MIDLNNGGIPTMIWCHEWFGSITCCWIHFILSIGGLFLIGLGITR